MSCHDIGRGMAEIIRIVIKGSSGYCCVDEAFKDKVTITENSIAYDYVPYLQSDINTKRKWSYKTNSPIFKVNYDVIAKMLPEVIKRDDYKFYTDIGGVEFNITYSDKTRFKETYWVPGDCFKDLFTAIKRLVPETEYIPAVLLTSEDYDDEEED